MTWVINAMTERKQFILSFLLMSAFSRIQYLPIFLRKKAQLKSPDKALFNESDIVCPYHAVSFVNFCVCLSMMVHFKKGGICLIQVSFFFSPVNTKDMKKASQSNKKQALPLSWSSGRVISTMLISK